VTVDVSLQADERKTGPNPTQKRTKLAFAEMIQKITENHRKTPIFEGF
jgi:hypothetical protein